MRKEGRKVRHDDVNSHFSQFLRTRLKWHLYWISSSWSVAACYLYVERFFCHQLRWRNWITTYVHVHSTLSTRKYLTSSTQLSESKMGKTLQFPSLAMMSTGYPIPLHYNSRLWLRCPQVTPLQYTNTLQFPSLAMMSTGYPTPRHYNSRLWLRCPQVTPLHYITIPVFG